MSSSSVTFYNLFLKFWSTGNETGYPCHHLFPELLIRHNCQKVQVRMSGHKHSELTFHLCTGEKTPHCFRLSSQLFSSVTWWKKSIPAPPVSVSSLRTAISVPATTNQPTVKIMVLQYESNEALQWDWHFHDGSELYVGRGKYICLQNILNTAGGTMVVLHPYYLQGIAFKSRWLLPDPTFLPYYPW